MTSIPATSGIYKITCTITGKFYIGSAVSLSNRRAVHWHHLSHKTHNNPKLQRAFNKYGSDAFVFEVLEIVLIPEMLTAREQHYLDTLKPFGKKGFNIDRIAGSRLGHKMLPHVKEALINSHLGKPGPTLGKKTSPETCEKLRARRLGKKHRPETIEEMCLTRIGHPVSARALTALRNANIARRRTAMAISPDGTEYLVHGVYGFCKEHQLSQAAMIAVAYGRRSHHKGWRIYYLETRVD